MSSTGAFGSGSIPILTGVTGICGPIGTGTGGYKTPPMPRIFCDKPEHKMYRAIRETCPCFKNKAVPLSITEAGSKIDICGNDIYLINEEGLAKSVNQLFDKVEEQEIEIAQLRNIVEKLLKEKNNERKS